MSAGQDLLHAGDGTDGGNGPLPWRWVYVRARTLLGHCNKIPYARGNTPATPSMYDQIVGTAEQVASRYVASDGNVWDLHDWLRVQVELLIAQTPPEQLTAARKAAGVFRKWPPGYPGTPPFEIGQ